jgi:hypothetical protein
MAKEPKAGPTSKASPKQKVRYQVLAPVFVNGSLVDPGPGKDLYVFAEPGLEGRALKLAPEPDPTPQSTGESSGLAGGSETNSAAGPGSL